MTTTRHTIECKSLNQIRQGKVRHVYDLDGQLLLVASDRVSAFDHILPNAIPLKGQVLTELATFWLNHTQHIVENHFISANWEDFPAVVKPFEEDLKGRSMLTKKATPFPVECVVRGYLMGSGWKEYQVNQSVCGVKLPAGLEQAQKLDSPIFTPATKSEEGHDENISFDEMIQMVGKDAATFMRDKSIEIYNFGADYCLKKGIILADTKFEFGQINDQIILIDEVMTPDSSRFWHVNDYQLGSSPPSYDKQIIRDYLEQTKWDKSPPIPQLPETIITKASNRYTEIRNILQS